MSKLKILICGGCGFMGSQFIRHLHNKYNGYEIYNLDLLTYAGNQENLSDLATSSRYHLVYGDIGDKPLIENLVAEQKFDVIINFAAESHVDRSIVSAVQFIKTNIQGAYVLLEAARLYRVPRFIYISTDEVYGDVPLSIKTNEQYPLRPTNPYAASKAAADLMVQSYMKTHRMPAIILRSSNNFGSYQYPEKLHSLTITNLLEGKKVPVHGKGLHIRSWLHVEDFCNALDLIMHKGSDRQIYNVAGEEKSNIEVIRAIAEVLGRDADKHVEYVSDRPGADFRYGPDCSRLSRELKWERQYSYNSTLPKIIFWYDKNPDWWKKIKARQEFQEHYQKQSKGQYDL